MILSQVKPVFVMLRLLSILLILVFEIKSELSQFGFSKLSNMLCKAPMCWCVAFKSQFLRSNDQSEPLNVIYISKFCRTSNLYFFRTSVLFFQIRRKLIGLKNSEPSNHYSFSVQKSNKIPNLSSYRFDKCAIVLSKAHQCAVTLLLDLDF